MDTPSQTLRKYQKVLIMTKEHMDKEWDTIIAQEKHTQESLRKTYDNVQACIEDYEIALQALSEVRCSMQN